MVLNVSQWFYIGCFYFTSITVISYCEMTFDLQFLKEELKYDSGYEKRQRNFHRNDDMHISVKELWEAWLRSEVHNWTVEQTTDWLTTCVELPQYVPHFINYKVTGANLPR